MNTFFSHVLTQSCLAAWVFCAVCLCMEWLAPGSVSVHLPLFPLVGGVVVGTCILAPWLSVGRRWQRVLGWNILALAVAGGLVIRWLNQPSSLVLVAASALIALLILSVLASFLSTRDAGKV